MRKFKEGLIQAIIGVIIGLVLTFIVNTLVNHTLIPGYSTVIFGVINLIVNIASISKMRSWGIFYTVGWLGGSLIFINFGLMDTLDIFFNVFTPVIILLLRPVLWLRRKLA